MCLYCTTTEAVPYQHGVFELETISCRPDSLQTSNLSRLKCLANYHASTCMHWDRHDKTGQNRCHNIALVYDSPCRNTPHFFVHKCRLLCQHLHCYERHEFVAWTKCLGEAPMGLTTRYRRRPPVCRCSLCLPCLPCLPCLACLPLLCLPLNLHWNQNNIEFLCGQNHRCN